MTLWTAIDKPFADIAYGEELISKSSRFASWPSLVDNLQNTEKTPVESSEEAAARNSSIS